MRNVPLSQGLLTPITECIMKISCLVLPLLMVAAPALADSPSAIAHLKGLDGENMGKVTFTQLDGVVLVRADLQNIPEGGHGFHIHETGKCAPDFGAAGDHFNPTGKEHGFAGGGPHAGDMPNIIAGEKGRVLAEFMNPRISLVKGAESTLFDEDGSAIIVHAKPDSYGKDAGAGDRIACGVIAR